MGNIARDGVIYFRHYSVIKGRTIDTLQSKYGNDGYAFWFKLLEVLAQQEGLYYDCSCPANWLFLSANSKISEEKASEIMTLLSDFGAIDRELWIKKRIIWVQKLTDSVADVYKKRRKAVPVKPNSCDGNISTTPFSVTKMLTPENDGNFISVTEMPQAGDFCDGNADTPRISVTENFSPIPPLKLYKIPPNGGSARVCATPSLKEVSDYCKEQKLNVNAEKFFEYYEAGGWKDRDGRRVANWTQKLLTWENNEKSKNEKLKIAAGANSFTDPANFVKRDYTAEELDAMLNKYSDEDL